MPQVSLLAQLQLLRPYHYMSFSTKYVLKLLKYSLLNSLNLLFMRTWYFSVASTAPPQPSAPALWSPSQPPLPDSPPPPTDCPPPPPLPPGSPPPPPPPPDSDGEIMEVEMEMDDDNDGEPPAPGTEEDAGVRPPLPPGTATTKVCRWWSCCFFSSVITDDVHITF